MVTRHVIGRRIVGVHQKRIYNGNTGKSTYQLYSITIEGGKRIIFYADETDVGPIVESRVRHA